MGAFYGNDMETEVLLSNTWQIALFLDNRV